MYLVHDYLDKPQDLWIYLPGQRRFIGKSFGATGLAAKYIIQPRTFLVISERMASHALVFKQLPSRSGAHASAVCADMLNSFLRVRTTAS